MDKKKRDGTVAGIGSFFGFVILLVLATNNEWNTSGQILWAFTVIFGGLSVGCLLKPETFGAAVSKFFERFSESEKGTSDSHKQIQQKSSGSVQVMTGDRAEVHINVPSVEKKQAEKPSAEEKEFLHKETIVVSPSHGYSYEFEFMKRDHLKGEISSTSRIDIYFVDEYNFDKWDRGRSFDYEDCNEGILETNIDYLAPAKGTWYVIIENKGRKSATVKVQLY